jgi:uncharacterized protein (TIGR02118 family)
MIKLTFCLRRLPHLTREEFQRYWLEQHGPLVASFREPLRIARYVQTHSLEPAFSEVIQRSRGGPEQYDGIAELWWASREDLAAATSTPEGRAAGRALLADERTFIDLAQSPLWFSEEHEIIPLAPRA